MEREADRYSHDKWYENFWYHYKWPVIIVIAVIAVGIYLIANGKNNSESGDMYILYVTGRSEVYSDKLESLGFVVKEYASDFNGDGKVKCSIDNLFIGKDQDLAAVYANKEKIQTALRAGTCMMVIFDAEGLEYFADGDSFCDLSVFVDPEFLVENGTVLHLNLTPFFTDNWETMEDWAEWTDDLYLGIRLFDGTVGQLSNKVSENYYNAVDFVKNIFVFKREHDPEALAERERRLAEEQTQQN